ncbi:MAG: CBS domain-containing protein [Pseudomonadota bacterium]
MTVRKILKSKGSTEILTITPDAKVSDATRILSERSIGALIVSADGESLNGMLSERDVLRELGKRGPGCLNDPIADLMTRRVVTASLQDTAVRALEKMTAGRFRHLPVVDDGRMVGVISIGDVVKYRIEEVVAENTALTDMIVGHG